MTLSGHVGGRELSCTFLSLEGLLEYSKRWNNDSTTWEFDGHLELLASAF